MKLVRKVGMLPVIGISVAAFVLWATLFDIDEAVHSTGQIIPDGRTQIIQAVDGGVLSDIRVHEGQSVKAGEVLAVLESNRARAAYEESRAKNVAIAAARLRAQAEASGMQPRFGREFKDFPDIVTAQQKLYAQRKQALDEALAGLRESLLLAEDELRMNENLFRDGDASRLDLLRARRQVTDIKSRIQEARNKYLQEANAELAKQEEEFSTSRYRQDERRDILEHTDLVSPVAGIVKQQRITTVGGVLRGGDEVMQISPTDGEAILEVRIAPADIGRLHTNLPANIRFDAFDYTVYGSVTGELFYLSSDTLTDTGPDGRSQTYYRGHIRIAANHSGISLKPGMTATADIRTGERSLLKYLFYPLVRGFAGALTER